MPTSSEIRQQFIDFFVKKHGHTFVPSSSVVPHGDETLLFSNAGMNQFKDVFLGTGSRPYKRAANTQKCIRAGGKHNDLDDVGKDTYHHTFFEMLGNWSFGDYFKREAIRWAWELLTSVWKLDKSRLHATVFEGDPSSGVERDDEAAELWRSETDIDPANIHWGNKKDNFWEMGETGPCGPCTEIHIDLTPDKSGGPLVNKGTPKVIEIWNLVFIQFNRAADKTLSPLPAKHVDTGMGFERVTAVLQGKTSNYDTDVFSPILEAIGELTGKKYTGRLDDRTDIACRVIADHLRMLTFAITDGALPDNKGRGAVIRSVLRRAFRFGYQRFDQRTPFLYRLVPSVVEHMGGAFPELRDNPTRVQEIVRGEEADFLRTIERGFKKYEEAKKRAIAIWERDKGKAENSERPFLSGQDIFDLHTTFGFPLDLTRQMAEEDGLDIDEVNYQFCMMEHAEKSRYKKVAEEAERITGILPPTDDRAKWKGLKTEGTILGWVQNGEFVSSGALQLSPTGERVGLILDRTCFYVEQGGQVGDVGLIETSTGIFRVGEPKRVGDSILHLGAVHQGSISVGQEARLEVDDVRNDTMRNHTATHLLNWALRRVLGDHVEQKGSLVDAEKTRFDFAHDAPIKPEEIAEVERLVNQRIYSDLPVTPITMPLAQAKTLPGVRAVFGEKYPDPVRVLMIGPSKPDEATPEHSVEFCGGTHLHHTGEAGFFKIVGQELVGKGVRRIIAVTGKGAVEAVQRLASVIDDLTARFNCRPEEIGSRIATLQEENKKLQQQLKKGAASDLRGVADRLLAEAVECNGAKIIAGVVPPASSEQVLQEMDRLRQKAVSAVVVVGWAEEDKVFLMAGVTDDLVKKGAHAGNLIKGVAPIVGGKGGGKPNMAQGGGKDASKLPEAMEAAKKLAAQQLGG